MKVIKTSIFLKLTNSEKARVLQEILKGNMILGGQNMISEETRKESYKTIDIKEKQKQVLECLGYSEMTAREVLREMIRRGYTSVNDRGIVAPRLTELFESRKLVIVAKKTDFETGKKVAVYRRA